MMGDSMTVRNERQIGGESAGRVCIEVKAGHSGPCAAWPSAD
jgi:hypothetical protein